MGGQVLDPNRELGLVDGATGNQLAVRSLLWDILHHYSGHDIDSLGLAETPLCQINDQILWLTVFKLVCFSCTGSLLRWVGAAALCCSAQTSHRSGFSCCGAPAVGPMGSVALQRVESSRIRDWTHVPCLGRQTPIHWTTRKVTVLWVLERNMYAPVLG